MKASQFTERYKNMSCSERISVLLKMEESEIKKIGLTHELYFGRNTSVDFKLNGKLIFGLNSAIYLNPEYFNELCRKDNSYDGYMKILSNSKRID